MSGQEEGKSAFVSLSSYLNYPVPAYRLKTARKCALQISRGPSFRSKPEQEQEDAISHMDEQAVQVHNQFMTLVSDLIDGTQDSSVYEDACRHLLGEPSSFKFYF